MKHFSERKGKKSEKYIITKNIFPLATHLSSKHLDIMFIIHCHIYQIGILIFIAVSCMRLCFMLRTRCHFRILNGWFFFNYSCSFRVFHFSIPFSFPWHVRTVDKFPVDCCSKFRKK